MSIIRLARGDSFHLASEKARRGSAVLGRVPGVVNGVVARCRLLLGFVAGETVLVVPSGGELPIPAKRTLVGGDS